MSALTRDRVVEAAIEILDAEGASGLTFRVLARVLNTGHGAIQWHVDSKAELLAAAAAETLRRSLAGTATTGDPRAAVRDVALGVFDAIDGHPWLGSQLFAAPGQPAMTDLWEQVGRAVERLGVRGDALFTAVSTVVGYVVGAAAQNAANAASVAVGRRRANVLDTVAAAWENLDPQVYPFVARSAGRLRAHDDREEFLAGVDIVLDGLAAGVSAGRGAGRGAGRSS